MSAKQFNKVYVITEHPECQICREHGDELEVHDDPADLMDSLLLREDNVALFIDVKYYIQLGAEARNRLMAVAQGIPHYRIRYDAASNSFVYIDDPRILQQAYHPSQEALQLRQEERVPVHLNAELAKEEDPFMQHALQTNITNISSCGCFVYCVQNTPYRGFAYVRIRELSNKRPIYCNIRWRREWGVHDKLPGIGMQFVDIQPDQAAELKEMYILPYLHEHDE